MFSFFLVKLRSTKCFGLEGSFKDHLAQLHLWARTPSTCSGSQSTNSESPRGLLWSCSSRSIALLYRGPQSWMQLSRWSLRALILFTKKDLAAVINSLLLNMITFVWLLKPSQRRLGWACCGRTVHLSTPAPGALSLAMYVSGGHQNSLGSPSASRTALTAGEKVNKRCWSFRICCENWSFPPLAGHQPFYFPPCFPSAPGKLPGQSMAGVGTPPGAVLFLVTKSNSQA